MRRGVESATCVSTLRRFRPDRASRVRQTDVRRGRYGVADRRGRSATGAAEPRREHRRRGARPVAEAPVQAVLWLSATTQRQFHRGRDSRPTPRCQPQPVPDDGVRLQVLRGRRRAPAPSRLPPAPAGSQKVIEVGVHGVDEHARSTSGTVGQTLQLSYSPQTVAEPRRARRSPPPVDFPERPCGRRPLPAPSPGSRSRSAPRSAPVRETRRLAAPRRADQVVAFQRARAPFAEFAPRCRCIPLPTTSPFAQAPVPRWTPRALRHRRSTGQPRGADHTRVRAPQASAGLVRRRRPRRHRDHRRCRATPKKAEVAHRVGQLARRARRDYHNAVEELQQDDLVVDRRRQPLRRLFAHCLRRFEQLLIIASPRADRRRSRSTSLLDDVDVVGIGWSTFASAGPATPRGVGRAGTASAGARSTRRSGRLPPWRRPQEALTQSTSGDLGERSAC